jgi:hypothetical protein
VNGVVAAAAFRGGGNGFQTIQDVLSQGHIGRDSLARPPRRFAPATTAGAMMSPPFSFSLPYKGSSCKAIHPHFSVHI